MLGLWDVGGKKLSKMEEKLGCFLGTFLGLKGKGKGPFINLLGKPCDMISS